MERHCRLCQSGEGGELIRPCQCRGTIEYAHPRCLVEWIARRRSLHCEVCAAPYTIVTLTRTAERPAGSAASAENLSSAVSSNADTLVGSSQRVRSYSDVFSRVRLARAAETVSEKVMKVCEIVVPLLLSVVVLPPLFFLMLYPFVRGQLEIIAERSIFLQVSICCWIGCFLVLGCAPAAFFWSSWLSWCGMHRDQIDLPFPNEFDLDADAGNGLNFFLQEIINLVGMGALADDVDRVDEADMVDDVVEAEAQAQTPFTQLAATFTAAAHADDVARGRLTAQHANVERDRDLILNTIDHSLRHGGRRPFWQRRFPSHVLREWGHLQRAMTALLAAFFLVPKIAGVVVAPLHGLLNQLIAAFLGVPVPGPKMVENSSSEATFGATASLSSQRAPTHLSLMTLALSNLLFCWVLKSAPLPWTSPRWRNRATVFYVFVRGLAMAICLATLCFHVSVTTMLLFCGDFVSDSSMPPSQLSAATAWNVLQNNDLAPIRCHLAGLEGQQGSFTHRVEVLRALRFVKSSFFQESTAIGLETPSDHQMKDGRSLFLVDEQSCGSFLTAALSTASSGGVRGTAYAHARYVVYCLWCIYRTQQGPFEMNTVALAVLSASMLLVTYYSDCLRGTKVANLGNRSFCHLLSRLTVSKTVRLAVDSVLLISVVTATVGRMSFTLFARAAPSYSPIAVDQLGWAYAAWIGRPVPVATQYIRLPGVVMTCLRTAVGQLFEVPPSLLEPPLLSLTHWRVPLRVKLTLAAYWATMLAGCVVLTAALIYADTMFVSPVQTAWLVIALCLVSVARTGWQEAAVRDFVTSRVRRAPRVADVLLSRVAMRYAVAVDVSLKQPWQRLWQLPSRMPTHEEEREWEVELKTASPKPLVVELQPDLPHLLNDARRGAWRDESLPVLLELVSPHPASVPCHLPFPVLRRLRESVLRRRGLCLVNRSLLLLVAVFLPLFVGTLPFYVPIGIELPSVTQPVVVSYWLRWVRGCFFMAVLFTMERRLLRTRFSLWVGGVLPYYAFHPLSNVGQAFWIPLLLRAGAMTLYRFSFVTLHSLEISFHAWRRERLDRFFLSTLLKWNSMLVIASASLIVIGAATVIALRQRDFLFALSSRVTQQLANLSFHSAEGGAGRWYAFLFRHGQRVDATPPSTLARASYSTPADDEVKAAAKLAFLSLYRLDAALEPAKEWARTWCREAWEELCLYLEKLSSSEEVVSIAVVDSAPPPASAPPSHAAA